jgi:hypothetical protein
VCVGRVVLGARRDPRSRSDSVISNDPRPGGQASPLEGRGFASEWYQSRVHN